MICIGRNPLSRLLTIRTASTTIHLLPRNAGGWGRRFLSNFGVTIIRLGRIVTIVRYGRPFG